MKQIRQPSTQQGAGALIMPSGRDRPSQSDAMQYAVEVNDGQATHWHLVDSYRLSALMDQIARDQNSEVVSMLSVTASSMGRRRGPR